MELEIQILNPTTSEPLKQVLQPSSEPCSLEDFMFEFDTENYAWLVQYAGTEPAYLGSHTRQGITMGTNPHIIEGEQVIRQNSGARIWILKPRNLEPVVPFDTLLPPTLSPLPTKVEVFASPTAELPQEEPPKPLEFSSPGALVADTFREIQEFGQRFMRRVDWEHRSPPDHASTTPIAWEEYVEDQVSRRHNWLARVMVDFSLTTGLRSTPWIDLSSPSNNKESFPFSSIPNFLLHQSIDSTIGAIVENCKQIKRVEGFEEVDVAVVNLTDAHLVDTSKESILQQFLSIRMTPLRRGKTGQYRYIPCIILSKDPIRIYINLQRSGQDLLVSMITRLEIDPAAEVAWWLCASVVVSFLLKDYLKTFLLPLGFWAIVYLLVPRLMRALQIVPKKANAHFLIFLLAAHYFVFLFFPQWLLFVPIELFLITLTVKFTRFVEYHIALQR